MKNNMQNILIFYVMYVDQYLFWLLKVWWRNLDYEKNLQAKYFTGENIPIYGIILLITLLSLSPPPPSPLSFPLPLSLSLSLPSPSCRVSTSLRRR